MLNKLCLFRTKTNEIVIHTSQFERNMNKGFSASDGVGQGQEDTKLNVDEIKWRTKKIRREGVGDEEGR